MVALIMTTLAIFGLVIVASSASASTAIFSVTVILIGFGFAPFVGDSLARRIPVTFWDRLSISRETSHRWGVSSFNALLSRIGWNKQVYAMREYRSTGDSDRWDPRHMQSAAAGHAWSFALHIITAILVASTGSLAWCAALVVVGIFGHLYPVLLQIRALTRRRELQPWYP